MKKEELFNDNFLKQFKSGDELNGFFEGAPETRHREDAGRGTGRPSGLREAPALVQCQQAQRTLQKESEDLLRGVRGIHLHHIEDHRKSGGRYRCLAEPPLGTCLSDRVDGRYRLQGQGILRGNQQTVYVVVGLRRDGKKEVLGLWLGKNESAAFWMSVLTDIQKARGTEDIQITAIDNLNRFTDTIKNVFPESRTQIHNACRYVSTPPTAS